MEPISAYCGSAQPGMAMVEYAPIAWVDKQSSPKLISSGNNWQHEIIFNQGGWMAAPLLPTGKLLDQSHTDSAAGGYWTISTGGIVLAVRPGIERTLAQMTRHRFVLRLYLRALSETPILLGTLSEPLEFTYSDQVADRINRYNINWKGSLPDYLHSYVPVL